MKTVLKYLLVGFVIISILGLTVLQIIQIIDLKNVKQSVEDLKTKVNSEQNIDLTLTPSSTPLQEETMTIKLYYKNHTADPDVLNCVADTYVERTIPKTSTPLTDAIKLLLKNDLTNVEKNLGLTNEFNTTPASKALSLISASISAGKATLTFNDPQYFTSGGSCRIGILESQVELTAKQFASVTSIEILPISTFQP